MDAKLAKIFYSPQGYWKGISAVTKLADAAKVLKWKCCLTVAIQAGHLADLSSCAEIRSSSEIWRGDAQLGPPGGPSFFTSWQAPSWKKDLQICIDCCRHCQPLQRSRAAYLKRLKRSRESFPGDLQAQPFDLASDFFFFFFITHVFISFVTNTTKLQHK